MLDKNQKFIKIELKYFDDAKFYEGINIHKDPGQEFIFNFIQINAQTLREKWEKSKCQHCYKWKNCGHLLKVECKNFKFDDEENEN